MPAKLDLRIDDEVRERLPDLRLLVLGFAGARVATAGRKLEPLRDRVLASARERVTAARDVRRIPAIAALYRAFPEIARTRRFWLDDAFRAAARRDPFPVTNDAVDAVRLLALHHAIPASCHDWARISGPLTLAIAPSGVAIQTPQGATVDAGGLPVLRDAGGPIGSPLVESQRAMPSTRTVEILIVAYDPGGEAAVDAADFRARAENWFASLSGARLVESWPKSSIPTP